MKEREEKRGCDIKEIINIANKKYDVSILTQIYAKGLTTRTHLQKCFYKRGISISRSVIYKRTTKLLEDGLIEESAPGVLKISNKGRRIIECMYALSHKKIPSLG